MKKILIVEDDKKLSLAWSIRIKSAGYEVSTCQDAFRGFTAAVTQRPDLILMDIWMPFGTGFSVAENLEQMDLGNIPIIFTTASRKPGLWERAQDIGAAGFLEKPVSSEKLLETIAATLARIKTAPPEPNTRIECAPKKILIVDDDKNIVVALNARLSAAGYLVLTAHDGLEGIKQAMSGKPDLVIMDVWMPVGLGFSVVQRLRQLGVGDIPIIFMTASRDKRFKRTAERLGAAAFVEKPYKAHELLSEISAALDPNWPQNRLHIPKPLARPA
jgi:DNA-binding response OmpR family regulator